jgi:hypothetical protein
MNTASENINANGSVLSPDLVRWGFFRFPQSEVAWLNPAEWEQIAPMLFGHDYPFTAQRSEAVPAGEVWFIGSTGELLGRIVNVGT